MTHIEIIENSLTQFGFKQTDKEINNGKRLISQDGEEVLTIIYSSPIRFTLEFPLEKKADKEVDFREKACIKYDGCIASYYSPETRKKIREYNIGQKDVMLEADTFDKFDSSDTIRCLIDACEWAKDIQKDYGYHKDERTK